MRPLLASLFDSLDGVTYFFVSSGIFVSVTATLFFSLGLWLGNLTWGRFKRRFRAGQETIEEMKNELALLKRRTAELASRTLPHQTGQPRAASRSPLAALAQSASNPQAPQLQPGAPFTLWTELGWTPQETPATPLPPSAAFSLWPVPEPAVEIVRATGTTTTAASGAGEAVHYTVEHSPHSKARKLPKSHAFTLWTEPAWKPHSPKMPALPPAASFSVWTEPGFESAINIATPAAPENPAAPAHSAVVAAVAAAVKSIAGFPKAGAATPTFGDWLHSKAARPGNGDSRARNSPLSPAEAFHSELSNGTARNDYLLGIVFNTAPAQRDDLSRLHGISRSERDALEAYGVHNFKQIAFWNRDHAEEFARRLGMSDTALATQWIGQAAQLLQEGGRAAS